jgi:enamine deaminase RidA (YjgF/YER057c/UK114 family)
MAAQGERAGSSPLTSSRPGVDVVRPRPEALDGRSPAPGIRISPQLDLVLFSGIHAYPAEIDPWNPGEFRLPSAPIDRAAMAADNLDRLLGAAGSSWQHIVSNTSYTTSEGDDRELRARMGAWSPCGTSVRVAAIGIPGVAALNEIVAVAPHRPITARGYVPGIEPVLPRPGMLLEDLPQAPAIRVDASVDLVCFPAVTAYPLDVDPWDSGGLALPASAVEQERLIERNVELLLRMAGITWRHVIHMKVTGASASLTTMRARFGDWRPCRTTRVVPTGIPGATLMCELTAVALTEERVD